MNIILIFTNFSSLALGIDDDRRGKNEIRQIKDNDFLTLGNMQHFVISTNINDGHLFLVKDKVDEKVFEDFLGELDKSQVGVLYHSLSENFNQKLLNGFTPSNCRKGTHEPNGLFYDDVIEILADDKPDKFERVKKTLFSWKKDLVINVLHEIWLDKRNYLPEEITNDNIQTIQDAFKAWETNKDLATLRNALLKWAKH